MSDNGLVWEDPPEVRSSRTAWQVTLSQLRENPGQWAIVYEPLNGEPAQRIYNKAQGLKTYAGRHNVLVETRSVKGNDGVIRVYARAVAS